MWRRSWLSREVMLFTLFTCVATVYSIELWIGAAAASILGGITIAFGIGGVGASARLYLVKGRPAWNSPFTIFEFFGTTALLGAVAAAICAGAKGGRPLAIATLIVAVTNLLKMTWCALSSMHELNTSWQLLSTVLANKVYLRFALLMGGLFLLLAADPRWAQFLGASMILAGEFTGRYLFFVSVVPMNIASDYLTREAA